MSIIVIVIQAIIMLVMLYMLWTPTRKTSDLSLRINRCPHCNCLVSLVGRITDGKANCPHCEKPLDIEIIYDLLGEPFIVSVRKGEVHPPI